MIHEIVRGLTTNVAETSESTDDRRLRVREYPLPASRVADAISGMTDQHSSWTMESRAEPPPHLTLRLTRRTRLFRFVDDVEVTLVEEGDRTTVRVVSRSRVGRGDLGQNRRNIRFLLEQLDQSLGRP